MSERAPVKPSDVMAFAEALNGMKGALDAWLECCDEHEVRETFRAYVASAIAAERAACAQEADYYAGHSIVARSIRDSIRNRGSA